MNISILLLISLRKIKLPPEKGPPLTRGGVVNNFLSHVRVPLGRPGHSGDPSCRRSAPYNVQDFNAGASAIDYCEESSNPICLQNCMLYIIVCC